MRNLSALGILFSLTILACAPVATSVPKMARISPSSDDRILGDKGQFDLRLISARVIGVDEAQDLESSLGTDFHLEDKFDAKSSKTAEILDTRGAKELAISAQINRAEVQVVFVLNVPAKAFSKEKQAGLKLEGVRQDKGKFSFWVSGDESSDQAWSTVKKNLNAVWILDRETNAKN